MKRIKAFLSELKEKGKLKKAGHLAAGIVCAVIIALYVYFSLSQRTDDAFTSGHIVFVSAEVSGRVVDVKISDNQAVKAGEPLLKIDPREYKYRMNKAVADFRASEAELKQAGEDRQRYAQLLADKDIPQQEYDRAVLRERNARAQLARMKAIMEQAQLDLEHTVVRSAIDGRVSARSVEKGQYIQIGQPLLSIVSGDVWAVANFKETQMTHIVPGRPAVISVDAYPGLRINGHIDSIQAGTGAVFSLLPPQNASGNFIKVVQRVPVKIVFDDANRKMPFLYPGLSVKVSVKISGK